MKEPQLDDEGKVGTGIIALLWKGSFAYTASDIIGLVKIVKNLLG